MRFFLPLILLAVDFIFLIPNSSAQSRKDAMKSNIAKPIDEILQSYDSIGSPGASVLVYEKGKVIYAQGYGLKNTTTGEKVSTSTCYRLASLTKQFTAMSILQLCQKGKLSLDSPAHNYLDSMPAYTKAITIRNLLTHTSGLVDYEDLIPTAQTRQLSDRDCLRLMHSARELYFIPGSAYRYSNTGYALLALIVQKVSGEDFAGYLRRHIFQPLGMYATIAFEEGKSRVKNRALGHSRTANGWKVTDQSLTSAVLGDGGIYTNVLDYSRWITALLEYRLIPDSVQQVAWQRARLDNGSPVNYGFGWHVDEIRGRFLPHHSGSSIGFRNHILLFPEEQRAVVLLTNRDEGNPFILAQRIADKVWPGRY
ncbi:MAG: serine hydrolase [Chitinophagaceae bacterium]|nr:serine hydrolase [Chitinophagaceae bacterium]